MRSLTSCVSIVRALSRILLKSGEHRLLFQAFINYMIMRLTRLLDARIDWRTLPDETVRSLAGKLCAQQKNYIDRESCLLVGVKGKENLGKSWMYICSKVSTRKCRVQVLTFDNSDNDIVIMSETARQNIENSLHSDNFEDSSFLLWPKNSTVKFASQAKVSLISNSHDKINQVLDILLENYFASPRYLRRKDIFTISTMEYLPAQSYLPGNPSMPSIYFKVNSIKVNDTDCTSGAYVVKGETSLIQESNVHGYLPRKCSFDVLEESLEKIVQDNNDYRIEKCPGALAKSLDSLESCIRPFIKKGPRLRLKPLFLVKGHPGSGKRTLVKIVSERLGLYLLQADLGEVQTLTPAQTEAKLRIVLQNAEQHSPCILCLNNIEVFGKNAEGQKDERVISAFANELNTLCEKRLKYPVIIIATSDESELPAELNRLFIETILLEHLDQPKRSELLSWLLKKRHLRYQANLEKLAGACSDFNLSDMSTLISHAVRIHSKRINDPSNIEESMILNQGDFDEAYEYMQSTYTDCKGTPRVPTVHWEDIGGLAELKHEIMRRIQLPLLNAFGFGQSGLLLYGPPGTGKTLLAKAVATEYQLHFLSIKGPEVLNMYVGQSEKNVRQVFERARAAAPCIIFFDELDSLAPNRGRSGDSGGVMDRVVSQLLAEMDGLDGSSAIFIIGATNRPDLIDPALLRPGRFDKMLYVGIHSDPASQLSVLRALTRRFKLHEDGKELERLAEALPKHTTGADLYGVCSNAWLNAARQFLLSYGEEDAATKAEKVEGNPTITVGFEDFSQAVRTLVPSVSEEEAERYRRMQAELSSTV